MRKNIIYLNLITKIIEQSIEKINQLQTRDTDNNLTLIEDFLELSESSLNEIWLTPEEDEAWKEL